MLEPRYRGSQLSRGSQRGAGLALAKLPRHAAKLAEASDVGSGVDDGGDELRSLRVAVGGPVSKRTRLTRNLERSARRQGRARGATRRSNARF